MPLPARTLAAPGSPSDSHASSASSPLLKAALLFIGADVLFSSFGTAFVYASFGVAGVLLFMVGWQLASTTAYIANVYQFGRGPHQAFGAYRIGLYGLLATLACAGLALVAGRHGLWPTNWPLDQAVLWLLLLAGGACRGISFSARTWLELKNTQGAAREAYLLRAEALGTVLKVALPLLSALALKLSADDFGVLFLATATPTLAVALPVLRTSVACPPAVPQAPWRLLTMSSYWATAPFYMLDGAGHALRTALYVSGAMAAVGSAAAFGMVEATSSLAAAALLWWQSHRPRVQPSLGKLGLSQALLALGWLSLMGALRLPWLLPLFVAAYALSHPFITVVKSGLTLKGLAQTQACAQDNLIARMVLLTLGRLGALLLALAIARQAGSPQGQLLCVCVPALLVLPLEFFYARRLSRGR